MRSRRSFLAAGTAALLPRQLRQPWPTDPDWRARKRVAPVHGRRMAYVASSPPATALLRPVPTFVLLHGNPTSSYLWRNIFPALEPLGACIAPDLIGMGDSDKLEQADPDRYRFVEHRWFLDGLLDGLAVNRSVILVLHDWGGLLGFDWARRHPERVAGIAHMETVLEGVDSSSAPPAVLDFFERYRTPQGEAAVLQQNQFVEQVLLRSLGDRLTEADRTEYRRPFLTPGEGRRPTLVWPTEVPIDGQPADVAATMEECQAWLATSPVAKLFVNVEPGALVATPGRKARRRSWPNTTEVVIPGHHFVQEESPATLASALAAWARDLDS
ncbi:MAG: haloalkane dehalogenase [Gemmatimonadota bacterium]|nr:haloalkane dehalogenase [Gemmatimonadota bacterium]